MNKTVIKGFRYILFAMLLSACSNAEGERKEVVIETIRAAEVHDVSKKWAKAMLQNDAKGITEVLDDTWVYSGGGDGSTANKTAVLANMKPGPTGLKGITLMDTITRLYGNFAVLTGHEELVLVDLDSRDTSRIYLRFTDVFKKENGKVTAVSTHSSPITTKE
ncbi:MAG: nuclear transport factor 2 family protein [Bacteroidota bacterium]